MYRVLHVTDDHTARNFGVTRVVNLVAEATAGCRESGRHVHILATDLEADAAPDNVGTTCQPASALGGPWRWSRGFASRIREVIRAERISVVHIHGVWMGPQWLAAVEARKQNIPFILTAHGMLEPWKWVEQGWPKRLKKQVYWRHVAYPAFRDASVIHAITPLERQNLQDLFNGQRVEVIPNAVDLQEIDLLSSRADPEPEPMIMYLGRIHPNKGIEILIRAFAAAKLEADWRLVIAGPVQASKYHAGLRREAKDLGIEGRVEFIGPIYGEKKYDLLKRAWAVAMPSYSEAIGMVNLEAAACRAPTITTWETGLWDWETGGGLLIRPNEAELSGSLEHVVSWDLVERLSRGDASRSLVERCYSMAVVEKQWSELYRELS